MKKTIMTLLALLTINAASAQKSELPYVYDVEHTGSKFAAPKMLTIDKLPIIRELPDPLEGVRSFKDWSKRRSNIGQMIQHYGIGTKPAVEASQVKARMDGDTLSVDVTVGQETLTLKSVIRYPKVGEAPYALMIGTDMIAIPRQLFEDRPIATTTFTSAQVNDYKQLQKGTIKIGIPPMMGAYLFPKIFSSFQKRYSHLEIFLHEEASMSIREQLERDELDFGIIIISGASQSLQLLPMSRNQIVCCVPENSPLAQKKSLSLQDVADSSMVMLKEGSFLRQLILGKLEDEGIKPNIVLESNQVGTLKGLVASGVGLAFLLDMVVEDTPGVKVIPLSAPLFVDVGLAWKKDRYISKAAQSFIDFCKEILKKKDAE